MRPSICDSMPAACELLLHRGLHLLDELGGGLALRLHPGQEVLVARGLEVLEGQVLELVLHLAHAQPAREGGVDVHGLAGDPHPPLLGQVAQGAHVVQAVGELDEDDPDVIHHREQHLAVGLGLALLGGGEGDLADLGDALHDVEHVGAEVLLDPLGLGQGVLEDVVQQAHRHAGGVHPHLGQDGGHLEGVHEVGLAGGAGLSLVLDGGEDVGLAQDVEVGAGVVAPDGIVDVLEADHGQMGRLSHVLSGV